MTKLERLNRAITPLLAQLGCEIKLAGTGKQRAYRLIPSGIQVGSFTHRTEEDGTEVPMTDADNAATCETILRRTLAARAQPAWGDERVRAWRMVEILRTQVLPNFRPGRHFSHIDHVSLDGAGLWQFAYYETAHAAVSLFVPLRTERVPRAEGKGKTPEAAFVDLERAVTEAFGPRP